MEEEAKLIKKAKKGDSASFEKLLLSYQDQLYRTAYVYVGNRTDALDIVQETAYKAYTSLKQLKEPTYFKTWLIRILITNAYDVLRKRNKLIPLKDEFLDKKNMDQMEQTENVQLRMELDEAIQRLDRQQQTTVILYYYHDFPIQQIAAFMKLPEGTVKTYLHRARKSLKKYMEGSDPLWIKCDLMTR